MQLIIEVRKPYSDSRVTTFREDGIINVREVINTYKVHYKSFSEEHIPEIVAALTNHVSEQSRYFIYNPDEDRITLFETNKVSHHKSKNIKWDVRGNYKCSSWIIEKKPLKGVKNSLAEVVLDIVTTLLQQKGVNFTEESLQVETSILMIGSGKLPDLNLLYNPMIEEISLERIQGKTISFDSQDIYGINSPEKKVEELSLEKLDNVNRKNALNLSEVQLNAIAEHFKQQEGRNYIRDIELEAIAQTWSEHCKHNIMSYPIDDLPEGIFRGYIKKATETIIKNNPHHICASVFTDNAGAIWFDENYLICVKVETHNSPSALEPFGGAMTGILGVNRDILGFGLGAKPIANYYTFCVGDPETEGEILYRDAQKTEPKLTPQSILRGIIRGVNVGGNCSGIPTPQGALYFSEGFKAKPLVFVGCVGIIPAEIAGKKSWIKAPKNGDLIVILGGKTGHDGIHGATFSSSEIAESNVKGTEVQLGDPFTQKKLSDAIIQEARDLGLYNAITDNGAGGFSSSVGEMGRKGFTVHLEKAPLKGENLTPWEIWISESQERMTLAVPKEKIHELERIMLKHDVGCTVIGEFNESGRGMIFFEGETIFNFSLDFLHEGNPSIQLSSKKPLESGQAHKCFSSLREAIKDKNICSRKFIASQYDHEVQGTSILKPLQGKNQIFSDTTAIKPLHDSRKSIAQSQDLAIITQDAYSDTQCSIEQSIRNLVTVGVNPKKIALLDNFCWSDSTNPERLWLLKEAGRACHDTSIALNTPFISGKDSMFNDFSGYTTAGTNIRISNIPSLLITAVGIVDDYEDIVSLDAKYPGDLIYLIKTGGEPQKIVETFMRYHSALKNRLVASAISVGLGGRLVAITKMLMANEYGATISLEDTASNLEKSTEIIVTVAPENVQTFIKMLGETEIMEIGEVAQEKTVKMRGNHSMEIGTLLESYRHPII